MTDRGVRVEPLAVGSSAALAAVVALGDQHRDRLGQLPYAVFTEAAEQSRLLVATTEEGGLPVGYALFRLPRNEISLTHLCVREDAREHGVATALVNEISRRHAARLGIRAKCRDDYALDGAWRRLGFRPRASAVGRGRDQAPMTVWWKDHGHPDLFTEYELPVELRAAIDLNIVRDLQEPERRNHRSDFLIADDLVGRLQLFVTSGMLDEIEQGPADRRQRLFDAIDPYPMAHADSTRAAALRELILNAVRVRTPGYPATPQDESDLTQVSHAAAAETSVFLTWDEGLRRTLGPVVAELNGMKIMLPDYVVVHLDELANAESFHRRSLEGSELSRTRAGSDLEDELDTFVMKSEGERKKDLRDLVRRLIHDGHTIELVHTESGAPAALFCAVTDNSTLSVPLLRLADHKLADTLARHLLWWFRRQARAIGALVVDITDPKLSNRLKHAANFESFVHVPDHWYAPIVDVCGTAHEVAARAVRCFKEADLGAPPLLAPRLSEHATAQLEHAWWPAKITDSELPCFVIPIRAVFAAELFGYPEGLTPRDTQLSLGREHVYYHSARGSVLTEPARVLWLSTGDGPGVGHFFAASALDSLMVDTPERLHSLLEYYGVFNLGAVTAAAKAQPVAEAVRFSNTEVFGRPVPLRRYDALRSEHNCGPSTFYSARKLPSDLYSAIYREGTGTKRKA